MTTLPGGCEIIRNVSSRLTVFWDNVSKQENNHGNQNHAEIVVKADCFADCLPGFPRPGAKPGAEHDRSSAVSDRRIRHGRLSHRRQGSAGYIGLSDGMARRPLAVRQ